MDIAVEPGASTIIELGSGASEKTATLLTAFTGIGQLERFVAVATSMSRSAPPSLAL